ncbi:hypothetical protein FRB93_002992 [Tulasnella sp. JGI-2019a]|nr:hypothetical protein FRB93_002992 [Tulasnella sp. JGI-2019a]
MAVDKSNRSHQVNSQWAKPELQKDQEFLTAQTQPRFSGEPGEDAADFVGNIQRIAFAQGRQRDDEWQADYAATCLAGPAMRWYCDLEDDKRMAWSNLRRSLLQHFPPLPLPTAPPAAPPPAAVSGHLSKPPRSKASVGPARNTEILSQTAGETTATSRGGTQAPLSRHTIRFYEITNPFYGFTNSSPHEVRFDGKMYPTSEHLFQSLKFIEHKPLLAERIRTIGKQPEMARSEAHRFFSEVREDWRDVSITMMEMVVLHKFDQHPALKVELFATGDAELVLDSGSEDAFWGNGADGKGRNEFGKALMRLRTHLRTNGRNQR